MNALSKPQAASREKTLLVALLLSMWAPLATGIAVILSQSTTQLADFIRRSVELLALFVAWFVFRTIMHKQSITEAAKARLERIASLLTALALVSSGIIILSVTLSRLADFEPGGNVYPGMAIAFLGLITNTWFWRRYARQTRELYTPIIDAQSYLYRAKAFVDLCVLAALTTVAIHPTHVVTRYVDLLGSGAVVVYLLWSGYNSARTTLNNTNMAAHKPEDMLHQKPPGS
jgi:divalent metal cation (Fe/Co/Zn/Cd) transporter